MRWTSKTVRRGGGRGRGRQRLRGGGAEHASESAGGGGRSDEAFGCGGAGVSRGAAMRRSAARGPRRAETAQTGRRQHSDKTHGGRCDDAARLPNDGG